MDVFHAAASVFRLAIPLRCGYNFHIIDKKEGSPVKRDSNLDLIRSVAIVTVLAVHFFLNSGFYDVPSAGLVLAAILRTQLMVCVPLFLLLTGYLNGKKTWSPGYLRSLGKLLLTYALACIFCCVFRAAVLGGPWSPIQWIRGMLNYSAAPYAWYVEMYIGLFLLIPFLNAAWNALPGKRSRRALTLVLLFLAVAPTLNDIFLHFGWQIIPSQWTAVYPVAYYFTGRWLREYPPRLRWWHLLVIDVLSAVVGGLVHLYKAQGGPIAYLSLNYWNGVFPYICAVSLFSLLRLWDTERLPAPVRHGFYRLARLSLPVFLLSWIGDQLVYGWLRGPEPSGYLGTGWLVPAVILVLIISVILAEILMLIQRGILSLPVGRKKAE